MRTMRRLVLLVLPIIFSSLSNIYSNTYVHNTSILLGAHKLRARRTVCKSVFFSKDISCDERFGAYSGLKSRGLGDSATCRPGRNHWKTIVNIRYEAQAALDKFFNTRHYMKKTWPVAARRRLILRLRPRNNDRKKNSSTDDCFKIRHDPYKLRSLKSPYSLKNPRNF